MFRYGKERKGIAWKGEAMHGKERKGNTWKG